MKLRAWIRANPVSLTIAVAIVGAWFVAALVLGQSLFAAQRSSSLMQIGAANGELWASREWWRLLTSQFLHVYFPHMLFNALSVLIVGAGIERMSGSRSVLIAFLLGGLAGQVASVVVYPSLVSSGASQALMALCGAAILLLPKGQVRLFAVMVIVVQAALDLYAAQTIKAGHGFGFAAGVILGLLIRWHARSVNPGRVG